MDLKEIKSGLGIKWGSKCNADAKVNISARDVRERHKLDRYTPYLSSPI